MSGHKLALFYNALKKLVHAYKLYLLIKKSAFYVENNFDTQDKRLIWNQIFRPNESNNILNLIMFPWAYTYTKCDTNRGSVLHSMSHNMLMYI